MDLEWPIPVVYRERRIDVGYRVDLRVEDRVLVGLKALTKVPPIHDGTAAVVASETPHQEDSNTENAAFAGTTWAFTASNS